MRRGLTLPEVLVVCGLLGLLTSLVATIFALGLKAQSKADATTTASRAALLAVEHLRRELRSAQVIIPDVGESTTLVTYKCPSIQNGFLKVDAAGVPEWTAEATLTGSDEALVKTAPEGEVRTLARLGPGGAVVFNRTQKSLLALDVVAYGVDARSTSEYRANFQLHLSNQP